MAKLTKKLLAGAALTLSYASAPSLVGAKSAAEQIKDGVQDAGGTENSGITLESGITTVVNVLLFLLAAISVIMIIVGGIRYTTSNGDQGNITSAKNTILYAVIGLVVAILAYAVVNFVIGAFIKR